MIAKGIAILRSPRQRAQFETLISAALILLGLAAGYLLRLDGLHDGLMTAAALVAGAGIAQRAITSLRNRYISIELLVTVATIGALLIGEVWEAAAVTFLFVLGATLEARTLARTRKVLGDLLDLAPVTAIVLREGRQVEVDPQTVQLGEVVLLKPGAKVPVDGEVLSGASSVDESMITGEPMPEEKMQGAPVYAGTINLDGMLQVRVTGAGADTTLARIIARVEEAQEEKAPTQRFVEKFARWYTPAILVLSAVVFVISRDIALALTLLVIACPGALVISTPVSVIAGIGQAARRGILIKGGEYLEKAGRVSVIALDKTGTLTEGRPAVTDVVVLQPEPSMAVAVGVDPKVERWTDAHGDGWSADQREVLFWAGVAENGSEHPLARAIVQAAEGVLQVQSGSPLPMPDDFQTFTGSGVRAVFQGRTLLAGKPGWLAEMDIELPDAAMEVIEELRADGKTAIALALDGAAVGVLGISDRLRPEVLPALARLRAIGIRRMLMLTGDDERTARAIARQAGLDEVRAGLLPEQKLEAIRELQQAGHVVAMVGDGINDAPALAAADISIAMGAAGSGVAMETAGIALMASDLTKVPEAIRLSRATLNNIHQNLAIALLTVSLLLAGVLLDEVHMASGMLIHQLSVLLVIFNGMRLLRVSPEK